MKWVIEENFENVAKFLGTLFDTTPEEINERFVNVPVMYVLKFIDKQEKILGTLIGVKDEVAPNILELLFIAFLPDINLTELNVFYKLVNFCKMEFIEAIYAFNIDSRSFVNINLEKLPEEIQIHKRMNMKLSLENYKQKWYDFEKKYLVKDKHDFIEFNNSFKLKNGKKSFDITIKPIHEISTDKIARLMNKAYSKVDFVDNIVLLSKNFASFNISTMMRLISGFYGKISSELSMMVENSKGDLVGYIINLEPRDKQGYIVDFVVDPDYREAGLGKLLFRNSIIRYFEEKNCESVSLAVTSNNTKAKTLYLKNGFEIVGREGKEGFLFIE